MQNNLHPDYDFTTVRLADGTTFTTRTTMGKDEHASEVDSSNHPFYTGKQTVVDTAGRVEKFMRKYGMNKKKDSDEASDDDTSAEGAAETDAAKKTAEA